MLSPSNLFNFVLSFLFLYELFSRSDIRRATCGHFRSMLGVAIGTILLMPLDETFTILMLLDDIDDVG